MVYLAAGLLLLCPGILSSVLAGEGGVAQKARLALEKMNLDTQVQAPVPFPKKVVKAHEPYQGGDFFTETRKDAIKRFKCSACHNNTEVPIHNAAKLSHADVVLNHGGKDGPAECNTCHSQKERDFLTTANGDTIDMDHVYDMCGQCHFRQKKDWIGGAHGKRVIYWAGRRVVKNCTSCHNPHSPRFEKRMPATYSVPLN